MEKNNQLFDASSVGKTLPENSFSDQLSVHGIRAL
jgi:hypothetical protein